ncbi:MAG TPA: AMP-binding protein [Pyrinomonadaceae bacterium]|nr:AMP-binding protein [Pyrinomonadaceae bacterium]
MGSTLPQINPGSIYDCLVARADTTPGAVVFAAPGRRPLTYEGLLRQTHAVRDVLTSMGLGRNSRVAIAVDNGPEMAVAFIAMTSCVTCIPLNPNYRVDEFEFYLSRLHVQALIVNAQSNSPAKATAETLSLSVIELSSESGAEAGLFKLDGGNKVAQVRGGFAQQDDVALLLHTSGTTSLPKIVPITHANICAQAANNKVFLNLTANDLCLNVMPLYHSTGLVGVVLSSVMSGGAVVCTPGFYAPHFLEWLAEFEPTWFTAVPSMHQAILARAANDKERVGHNRLRFIRSSSAALPRHTLRELETVFKTSVIESYGLTECGMIACNPIASGKRKIGSVGVPTHVELRITDESGAFLSSPDKGEIAVRGECVIDAYEGGEEVNEQSFTDGWFRTGDLGFLDSDGYLFITGRRKEIINRGGEKISPLEVDQTFMDHVAVEQA